MVQPRKPKGSPNGTGGQYDVSPHGADGLPPMLEAARTSPDERAVRELYRRFMDTLNTYPEWVSPDLSCDFTQGTITINGSTRIGFDVDDTGMTVATVTGPDATACTMPVVDAGELGRVYAMAIRAAYPDAAPMPQSGVWVDEYRQYIRDHTLTPTMATGVEPGSWPDPDPDQVPHVEDGGVQVQWDGTVAINGVAHELSVADRYRLARDGQYEPEGAPVAFQGATIRIAPDPRDLSRRIVSFPDGTGASIPAPVCRFGIGVGCPTDPQAASVRWRWDEPGEQQCKRDAYLARKQLDPQALPDDLPAATRRTLARYGERVEVETQQRHARLRRELDGLRQARVERDMAAHRALVAQGMEGVADRLASRLCTARTYGDVRTVIADTAQGVDGALLRQAAGRVMPLIREAPDMVRVDAHHVDVDAVRSMVAAWFIEAANRTWN